MRSIDLGGPQSTVLFACICCHRITQSLSMYRGSSLIRNVLLLGTFSRPMPRVLGFSKGQWRFLMSEVPL